MVQYQTIGEGARQELEDFQLEETESVVIRAWLRNQEDFRCELRSGEHLQCEGI